MRMRHIDRLHALVLTVHVDTDPVHARETPAKCNKSRQQFAEVAFDSLARCLTSIPGRLNIKYDSNGDWGPLIDSRCRSEGQEVCDCG